MWEQIESVVPNDHPDQVTSEWMVGRFASRLPPAPTVVDLGCGTGRSYDFLSQWLEGGRWIGVDIKNSPEVDSRKRNDLDFREFDGVNIPLQSGSADLVFSRQVMEHVRYPEQLLQDVARILKPGGLFVGGTSHLEPYHSYQYWNFTPFGFKAIVETAGMEVLEMRPGIDGRTLVQRTYDGRPKSYSRFFAASSPLNVEIDDWGRNTGRSVKQILVRKLSVCGQFCFCCQRLQVNDSGAIVAKRLSLDIT